MTLLKTTEQPCSLYCGNMQALTLLLQLEYFPLELVLW